MIVSRSSFDLIIERLRPHTRLSVDTETTGVRPYHGDRLFSIIIGAQEASGKIEGYYFNFYPSYEGLAPDFVLTPKHLSALKVLFSDPTKTWDIHNFDFDMHMLSVEGIEIAGDVFCTLTQGRVEYNEHFKYDLASSLSRIGLAKDDAVGKWIDDQHAWEWQDIPGKKTRIKNKFFYKVPYDIIVPYGISDATGGLALGHHLRSSMGQQSALYPKGVPTLSDASAIETRLAKTVYRMAKVGVKIDRPYCVRAARFENDRAEKAAHGFKKETGRDYAASPKLFSEIFAADRDRWSYTEKGNPSFESDVLKTFQNPAAKTILQLRDAKSRLDFYNGFLWHADADDVIHPHLKPGGTRTMRFSSSEPNLQNLTSEDATFCRSCQEWFEQMVESCPECLGTDVEHPEFLVRRAIIPRPGYLFILPDWDQMEYKMMLEYAKKMMINRFKKTGQPWVEDFFSVANQVRDGFDVHQATAQLMGVKRKYAKTLNFMLLYGGGPAKLAAALGISLEEAVKLRTLYFKSLPYVQSMINEITQAVRERGWLRNWAGYKYNFPDRNYAYTGPNTVIQGGCAAVAKISMNRIDELLLPTKSRMVLSVHDELPCEIHESEVSTLPRMIHHVMETTYPHQYIPLTAGMEYSTQSLADKKKGFPA